MHAYKTSTILSSFSLSLRIHFTFFPSFTAYININVDKITGDLHGRSVRFAQCDKTVREKRIAVEEFIAVVVKMSVSSLKSHFVEW